MNNKTNTMNNTTGDDDGKEIEKMKEFKLDDFEILKTIGTGTFARVTLVRNKDSKDYHALKILSIHDIVKLKQVEHVKNEKKILQEIQHPFLITLDWFSKDKKFLYMLFPFIVGGELFSYLRSAGRFSSQTTLFYCAEIISALEYLHSLSIIYRDLKPENLILDKTGHLKIIDFGFAKRVVDKTWTLCGTPEYLAPEIIQSKGHNKAVDWWALGILTYEMLAGYPPFYDDNPFGIYEKILTGKIEWPRHVDQHARDFIKKLLVCERSKRLGNLKGGAVDVKKHRWLRGVDWDLVEAREMKPPIIPRISHEGDTHNFESYQETDLRRVPAGTDKELRLFDSF